MRFKKFLKEDIQVFAPQDKLKAPKYKKIKIFNEGWQKIQLPPPPPELPEVDLVIAEIENATPKDIEEYKNCDTDASYYIKKVLDRENLEYDNNVIEFIEEQCVPIIRHYKNHFNRPRPYQVAAFHNIELKRFKTGTSKSPSYPSGHAVQPLMVAYHYANKYNSLRNELLKAARICGYGRVIAGLHYPSDFKSGVLLASKLEQYMNYEEF